MERFINKTTLGCLGIGVVTILHALQVIDEKMANTLLGLLLTFTGVSMRLAIRKNGAQK